MYKASIYKDQSFSVVGYGPTDSDAVKKAMCVIEGEGLANSTLKVERVDNTNKVIDFVYVTSLYKYLADTE